MPRIYTKTGDDGSTGLLYGGRISKADLVASLRASFDYCDPIYESMTDVAGVPKVKWFIGDMSRLGLLNWNISHDNEMYGTAVAYLRIKGIVPPSSDRRP